MQQGKKATPKCQIIAEDGHVFTFKVGEGTFEALVTESFKNILNGFPDSLDELFSDIAEQQNGTKRHFTTDGGQNTRRLCTNGICHDVAIRWIGPNEPQWLLAVSK
ncbi:MAG: hypothetical protein KGI71_02555 [Patescibacteria group bacterium]|nr:hypothetical protein [Patescibacteria group bacterium]